MFSTVFEAKKRIKVTRTSIVNNKITSDSRGRPLNAVVLCFPFVVDVSISRILNQMTCLIFIFASNLATTKAVRCQTSGGQSSEDKGRTQPLQIEREKCQEKEGKRKRARERGLEKEG